MTDLLMCSKCGLTGDDLEKCGNIGSIGCPDPVMLDPTKVVLLRCGPCDKTRALPVDDIMHPERTIQRRASVCQFQKCNAVVVLPEPAPVTITKKGKVAGATGE